MSVIFLSKHQQKKGNKHIFKHARFLFSNSDFSTFYLYMLKNKLKV